MKLKATNGFILVEEIKEPKKEKVGSIFIPEDARPMEFVPKTGKVVAVPMSDTDQPVMLVEHMDYTSSDNIPGDVQEKYGLVYDNGRWRLGHVPMGAVVYWKPGAGIKIRHEGQEYVALSEAEILAHAEPEEVTKAA